MPLNPTAAADERHAIAPSTYRLTPKKMHPKIKTGDHFDPGFLEKITLLFLVVYRLYLNHYFCISPMNNQVAAIL